MRNGFGFGIDEKFVSVVASRFAIERRAPAAEHFFEAFERNGGELLNRLNLRGGESRFGDFADAWNFPHAERREESSFGSRRNPNKAAGFGLIAGDFGNKARGSESAGAGQTGGASDFIEKAMGGGERRAEDAFRAGEVEIGFVDGSHFDDGRVLREDGSDAIAPLRIELMTIVEKNGVRAELAGGAQRHGRMNAEFASFVAGGSDYAALILLATDDNGKAAEVGTLEEFDGDEECIHVDVKDGDVFARGGRRGTGEQRRTRRFVFRAILSELGHAETVVRNDTRILITESSCDSG